MTSYESSGIDWCENNYSYSRFIAEFWNTISSLFIGYIGYIQVNKPIRTSIILLGVFSAYFHATLSLLGQILDELSITIVIVITLIRINGLLNYTVKNMAIRNKKLESRDENFTLYLLTFLLFQLMIQFYYPFINRFVLFLYIYIFVKRYKLLLIYLKNRGTWDLSIGCFIIAFAFWILDFVCLQIPVNCHAIWHVLIGIMIYFIDQTLDQYLNNVRELCKYII